MASSSSTSGPALHQQAGAPVVPEQVLPEPLSRTHGMCCVCIPTPMCGGSSRFNAIKELAEELTRHLQHGTGGVTHFIAANVLERNGGFIFHHSLKAPVIMLDRWQEGQNANQTVAVLNTSSRSIAYAAAMLNQLDADAFSEKRRSVAVRLAALLADLATWPVSLPIAQLGGYGGGDVDYEEDQHVHIVPVARTTLHDLSGEPYRVRVSNCDPRARMDEALMHELAFLYQQERVYVAVEAPPEYVPPLQGRGLLMYSPQFARFVRGGNAPLPDPNLNPVVAVSLLLKTPIIDRTGTIRDPDVKVTVLDPLDSVLRNPWTCHVSMYPSTTTQNNPSFRTEVSPEIILDANRPTRANEVLWQSGLGKLIDNRASQLLEIAKAEKKPIHLMWSGGIDSTVALVALMKLGPEAFRQAGVQLVVRYERRAIDEFPSFYRKILRRTRRRRSTWHGVLSLDELRKDPSKTTVADFVDLDNSITVTGEHGDQLFGSILMKGAFKKLPSFIFRPDVCDPGAELMVGWQYKVRQYIVDNQIVKPEMVNTLMSLLEQQASHCPFAIENVFDWLWWCNFSMKWQYVTLRMLNRMPDLNAERASRLHHFYRTEDFQRWSLHPEIHRLWKMPRRATNQRPTGFIFWRHYKLVLKAYIYSECAALPLKDRYNYLVGKEKEGSLRHQPSTGFAMTDAYENISFGGYSIDPQALRCRYGDNLQQFLITQDNPASW